MPTVTHEPSGLIALRALEELERDRRAAEAAREAAAAEARARAEAAAREAAEARARAAAEAAEQARRAEEARRHEERLRAVEIEATVRAAQAAHLARVQAELDASIAAAARRTAGRIGLWTAGSLGLVGLGLALLLRGTAGAPPVPVLAPADDAVLAEARQFIADQRRENARLAAAAEAAGQALAEARVAAPPPPAAEPEPPVARPRPAARPAARPQGRPTTGPGKRDFIKTCATDDPLAEDC